MLIIFDCDGVLVDSEGLAAEVFSEVLAEQGISFSPEDCYRQFHGHTLDACFAWLDRHFSLTTSEAFADRLAGATRERFRSDLRPVDGVLEVLELLLTKNIPFCVASNGEHKKINHSLSVTGLERYFPTQRRFSRDDVARGKPAPDLFILAAESVGVAPVFCTVIEDSESGFQAAQSAGMQLIKFLPGIEQDGNLFDGTAIGKMTELLKRW